MAENGIRIESRRQLEAWLEDKHPAWAQAIAARAALRVLPLIGSETNNQVAHAKFLFMLN